MACLTDNELESLKALIPREFLRRISELVQERRWGSARLELNFQDGRPTTNKVGVEVTSKLT